MTDKENQMHATMKIGDTVTEHEHFLDAVAHLHETDAPVGTEGIIEDHLGTTAVWVMPGMITTQRIDPDPAVVGGYIDLMEAL